MAVLTPKLGITLIIMLGNVEAKVNQRYASKLEVSSDMAVDVIEEVKSEVVAAKVAHKTTSMYH